MSTVFRWGNLEKGDRLEVLGQDVKVILKWIIESVGEGGPV